MQPSRVTGPDPTDHANADNGPPQNSAAPPPTMVPAEAAAPTGTAPHTPPPLAEEQQHQEQQHHHYHFADQMADGWDIAAAAPTDPTAFDMNLFDSFLSTGTIPPPPPPPPPLVTRAPLADVREAVIDIAEATVLHTRTAAGWNYTLVGARLMQDVPLEQHLVFRLVMGVSVLGECFWQVLEEGDIDDRQRMTAEALQRFLQVCAAQATPPACSGAGGEWHLVGLAPTQSLGASVLSSDGCRCVGVVA